MTRSILLLYEAFQDQASTLKLGFEHDDHINALGQQQGKRERVLKIQGWATIHFMKALQVLSAPSIVLKLKKIPTALNTTHQWHE